MSSLGYLNRKASPVLNAHAAHGMPLLSSSTPKVPYTDKSMTWPWLPCSILPLCPVLPPLSLLFPSTWILSKAQHNLNPLSPRALRDSANPRRTSSTSQALKPASQAW